MADVTTETTDTENTEAVPLVSEEESETERPLLGRRVSLAEADLDLDDDDDDDDADLDDDDDEGGFSLASRRRPSRLADARGPEAPSSTMEDRDALSEAARDQLFVPPPEPPEAPKRRGRPPKVRADSASAQVRDRLESLQLEQAEQAATRQKALHEEFYDMMTSLDFGSSQHRIAVARLSPEYDTDSGKRIVGHLETFPSVISPDEIRQKYGGGKYQLTLMGPKASGTGVVIKAKRTIEISGDPLIPENPKAASKNAKQKESDEIANTLELVRSIVDAKDKDVDRAFEEARETKQLLLQTLASKNEASSSGLKEILTALNQTSAKDKEALMEERRLQEDRLRQEREERRQELEMMRLQHEKAMETMRIENQRIMAEMQAKMSREADTSREMFLAMQKMESDKAEIAQKQHERMLEMMRLENERVRAEIQARAGHEAQSSKEMLVFMQKMESEKTAQAQKQQEFALQQQMQNQQLLMQQMQQIDQTKTTMLMDALKEAKSQKDDLTGTLEKLVAFKSAIGSLTSEPDDREPYEKIIDKVGEMGPGILSAWGAVRGGAGDKTAAGGAQPQLQPNTVAVVDLPEQKALPASPKTTKKRPHLPKRPAANEQAPVETSAEKEVRTNPGTPPPAQNETVATDATEKQQIEDFSMENFIYPEQGTDVETSIKMLVQNIEISLHKEKEVEDFFEEVASKFPVGVLSLLKLTSSEKCVEILEQMAPDNWMINTPAGSQYVEELHELLSTK